MNGKTYSGEDMLARAAHIACQWEDNKPPQREQEVIDMLTQAGTDLLRTPTQSPAIDLLHECIRKDAERYRWLRAGEGRSRILPHIMQAPYVFKTGDERTPQIHDANGLNPEMLDAAIDAAIAAGEAPK